MEMKYYIRISIFARYGIRPQFLHEKHLVRELWNRAYGSTIKHQKKKTDDPLYTLIN